MQDTITPLKKALMAMDEKNSSSEASTASKYQNRMSSMRMKLTSGRSLITEDASADEKFKSAGMNFA
jgi:hypothetical protein